MIRKLFWVLLVLVTLVIPASGVGISVVGNGDFEARADGIPVAWENINGGKLACSETNCEYRFAGNGKLQSIAQTYIVKGGDGLAGDVLNVSIDSRWRNWTGRKILKAILVYDEASPGVLKVPLRAANNTGSLTATGPYSEVKIKVIAQGTTGRLWVDNVSATINRN